MTGRPAESSAAWTGPGTRGLRPTSRSTRGPGHVRPGGGQVLRTAVSRLAHWPLARKSRSCPSRAPVAYMDGLSIHDLYRWQRQCELPTGHAGEHRSDGDCWG